MITLFESENKNKIVSYLAENPDKSAKEITEKTQINYKNTYKILQELLEKQIVIKKENQYHLTSQFIEHIKKFSDTLLKNHTNSLFLRNKLDLYNTLITLYPEDDIKENIDTLIENWLVDKLDDWFSKFYDLENKEYKKIKKIINNQFNSNNLNILEVGCGTGRITEKLSKDFKTVTGIDYEEKFISYCNKKYNNIEFETADIKDFKTDKNYDVILFSWTGLHYQENIDLILNNIKQITNENTLIIILDAYYETEYINILQMIRPVDMNQTKLLKEKLNEKLAHEFGNLNQEVLFTKYTFETITDVINNFKIELTLEESHIWTKDDESTLKEYLHNKENSLEIQEGLWITTIY